MKTNQTPLFRFNAKALAKATLFFVALSGTAASAAVLIEQSNANFASGNANYGQQLVVDSGLTGISGSAALESVTFWKDGGSSNIWIDVYDQGSQVGSPDFDNGNNTANLNYLGSSSAAVDFGSASSGDPLEWTFTSVTLPVDTNIYLVLSTDSSDGNWVGRALEIVNNGSQSFTNIVNADSNPLFGGSPNTDITNDNRYSVEVVPEPSAAAVLLGAFALLLSVARRRARR